MTAEIPDDRPHTPDESALVRWLLAHSAELAAGFVPQLELARVVSRCPFGCASVNLAIAGVTPPPGPIGILADFEYRTAKGHLCGAFLFERAGLLAGLDVWSVDGQSTPSTLPSPSQLRLIGSGSDAEPRDAADSR